MNSELSPRRVCVFCGSKSGTRPAYLAAARETGRAIGRAGLGLVYGGAASGLMGAVADGALEVGAEVTGVIPGGLVREEFLHPRLTASHLVDSMHERKALMHELSGAFLALPGGFGTLDELCEAITWSQLGLHRKPIGLLDVEGYFQPLLQWVKRAVEDGFVARAHEAMLVVEARPEVLLERVLGQEPSAEPARWNGQRAR